MGERQCVEQVVLFGSMAEGRAIPGSDVDLLLILDESHKPSPERIEEWLSQIHLGFPIDVFPYTRAELNTPFIQEVLRRGVVLFDEEEMEKADLCSEFL